MSTLLLTVHSKLAVQYMGWTLMNHENRASFKSRTCKYKNVLCENPKYASEDVQGPKQTGTLQGLA